MKITRVLLGIFLIILPLMFLGCSGDDGASGAPGASAPTTGTISGTVTDAVKKDALTGVTVTATMNNAATTILATATTDALGNFSMTVPIGGAYVNFSKTFYTPPGGMFVGIGGNMTTTVNATMSESAAGKPSITFAAVAGDDFGYGATVALAASATDPNDPASALTYTWENATGGVPKIGTVTGTGTTGSLTFPTMAESMQPRKDPTNFADISGYIIEDRFGIVPVIPDTRPQITARVTVQDGRGQSSIVSLTLNAASVQTGARNVAVNSRVYLNRGDDNNAKTWTFTPPAGSTATLDNASVRHPSFVPDVEGKYTVAAGGNSMDIYAGKWVGVIGGGTGSDITPATLCLACHFPDSVIAVDKITPWKGTGHARIFTLGIDNGAGTSGSGCLDCHTVGYDKGTVNGGFDDVAAAAGFVFPSVRKPGNWEAVPTAVKALANIQCENCHGPNGPISGSAHMTTGPPTSLTPFTSPRITFNAEVCGTCHGRTSHNIYSQWNTRGPTGRGHSNKLLSDDEGTGSTSCARCHGAQGFFLYQKNLKASTKFTLSTTDINPITSANVQPQTCSACHDPHDATNPNQLRIYNNTPGTLNLPAGFRVAGWGKGALCVTCHNTRNGAQLSPNQNTKTYLHEDGETYNPGTGVGDPTGYSAPHTSSQGDVVAGRNAYFLGAGNTPMLSKHAAVEDVCVGCHMALNAKSFISHGEHTAKTHLFRLVFTEDPADPETQIKNFCANCHGEGGVNGEAIIGATETGLANLAAKIGTAAKTKINDNTINGGVRWVRAFNAATDLYSSIDPDGSSGPLLAPANVTFNVNTNPVVSVGLEEGHGQIEFHITLTNAITFDLVNSTGAVVQTITTNEFGVQLGSLQLSNTTTAASQTPLYGVATSAGPRPETSKMVRAGWNFFLIEADDSKGIHNPGFVHAVLNATLAQDLSN